MASEKVKEHYDKNVEGNWVCKHCRQVLAKGTSLTRLKFHLSGEEGRGVRVCKDVPPEVKQADYLSVESNKRQKTMPPHHVDVGVVKRTIPSSSREQPSHFDNGGGMHSESQHHLEPSVSVSSLLPSINVDFDNGGEMLSGFQHQPEPELGEQGMPLPTESRQPVEGFVAPKSTQGDALITTNFVGECFQSNMDEIWTWLIDDDVTRIGIWGMAGVGKTELAKHVHNKLLQIPNQFDHVYWVTVSPDFTVHKLQDSFGKSLGLDLSNEEDEHKRAAKLSKALNGSGGCKKCMFILDDAWNYLPLHDRVGIPASTKLILTSRSLDVCRMISCQKKIKVQPLRYGDGWELFKQTLGQEAEALPSEILEIARLVSNRCGGMPLAIIWMSISMREVHDEAAWENALEKLRKSKTWQQNTEVFQNLKLSYDYLNDSALQQCFLYCAFYVGSRRVRKEVLIAHLIDEGIISPKRSRNAELKAGHMMLKKLENACLLEEEVEFDVNMNQVTWDLAYHVHASCTTMVELWAEFEELPDVEEWTENLGRVSLMDSDIVEIPSGYKPRCPNLLMLLLGSNQKLKSIADSFFEQFHKLKVLDLSGCTNIEKLPDSLSNLVNFTTLLLSCCLNLRHVPSLAKLGELKTLDLRECYSLIKMPEGVGSLSKLKYLDLSGTGIKEISSGIIANLSALQVLKLMYFGEVYVRAVAVEVEGRELGRLRELETLECHFQHVSKFMEYMESRRECGKSLSEYTFLIGEPDFRYDADVITSKDVVINDCNIQDYVALPPDVLSLWISECHDFKELSVLKNTTQLESIRLFGCDEIEILVSLSLFSQESNTLKSLQKLKLHDLVNLRGLIGREEANVPTLFGFLSNLNTIYIGGCHRVKRLFPPNLLPNLHNLENIDIIDCQGMEEIFSMEEEDDNSNNCPTSVSPINLPSLVFDNSFCTAPTK